MAFCVCFCVYVVHVYMYMHVCVCTCIYIHIIIIFLRICRYIVLLPIDGSIGSVLPLGWTVWVASF